jgi:cellulose synthase/poly-beta-1,6-N-acetylglucosamine synthase-like glycosyltransferase
VSAAAPRVSVVIPAYHSDATIGACLDGLRAQSFQDFEAIVVNSSDETRTGAIAAAHPLAVVFEQSPTRLLPHAARNRGAARARGRILVFTDPDCRPRPDWLERLVAAHDAGHAVVAGAMGLASERWLERGIHLCKFSWALATSAARPCALVPTANALYGRAAWEAAGPFDDGIFCADALLGWRAARHGFAPWFEPRAVVEHRHPDTLASLWRQRLARGEEFGRVRMALEGWTRARAALHLAATPLRALVVLARAGRDAARGGWLGRFVATLPVQVVGQGGWCLGEARAQWRVLRG